MQTPCDRREPGRGEVLPTDSEHGANEMNKKSPENVQDEAGEMGRPGGCVKNYILYIKEACGFHLKTGPI